MALGGERLALASFVAGSVLAGGNAVGVRFSNRELAPLWGAGLRFGVAATLLFLIMAAMRLPLPRGRALLGTVLYGLLNFAAAFALAYYALVHLHAGLGQTLLALVPLSTLLLAVVQGQERLVPAAAVGTVLAIAGIAVISQAPLRASAPPLALLAVLGSVLCFAQAAVTVRRFPSVHPVTMNAVAMMVATVALVAGSALAGEAQVLPERAETWAALAYLVVVGSMLVFVLYLVVLHLWSASRAAYTFVVVPVVTVLLSAWLDDEPITVSLLLGGVLVIAGVYVGALRRRPVGARTPAVTAAGRVPR